MPDLASEEWETYRRMAQYYADRLMASDTLYLRGGEATWQALAQFDEDLGQILLGQARAAAAAVEHQAAAQAWAQLCLLYPQRGQCLSLRLPPSEQAAWSEAGLAAARRLKETAIERQLLITLGIARLEGEEPQRAIDPLREAWRMAQAAGDQKTEQAAAASLGAAYWSVGQAQPALTWNARALNLARQIGSQPGESVALGNIGSVLLSLNQPVEARRYFEAQLAVARAVGDQRAAAMALSNLGACHLGLGEPELETEFYEEALAIFQNLGDRAGEGKVLTNLGLAYLHRDRARAVGYLREAERLFLDAHRPAPVELTSALTALAMPGCLLSFLTLLRPLLGPLTRLGGMSHRTQAALKANPSLAREMLNQLRGQMDNSQAGRAGGAQPPDHPTHLD